MKAPSYSEWSQQQSNINPFWWSVKEEKRLALYKKEYPKGETKEVEKLMKMFGIKY